MVRKILSYSALLVSMLLASCVFEPETNMPGAGREVTFYMQVSGKTGITRSGDSTAGELHVGDDIRVFAFTEVSAGNYEYGYTPEVRSLSVTDGVGKFTTTLKVSAERQLFLILANASGAADNVMPQKGETLEEISRRLHVGCDYIWPAPYGESPAELKSIPMCANTGPVTITEGMTQLTNGGKPFLLVRMLARVDITLASTLTEPEDGDDLYSLEEVYIFRANKGGSLVYNNSADYWEPSAATPYVKKAYVPDGTAQVAKGNYMQRQYVLSDGETAGVRSAIYMPEAEGVDDKSKATALVVGIDKNGAGELSYYRIDITAKPGEETASEGTTADIMRNFIYDINIAGVVTDGYPDPETAYDSVSDDDSSGLLVYMEVADWNNISIFGPSARKLNVSSTELHLTSVSGSRLYFWSDQPVVELYTLDGMTYPACIDMESGNEIDPVTFFTGISGDNTSNFHYEWDSVTKSGKGYVDLISHYINPGDYTHMMALNATHTSGVDGMVRTFVMYTKVYNDLDDYAYVGTFHRADETGERVIIINCEGPWTAVVDDHMGSGDFVKLSTSPSLDPGLMTDNPGNPEDFQVEGDSWRVSGNGRVYFRVGMKSTYMPTADAPARYATISMTINDSNHKIYVRQGEGADYVFRPTDTYGNGKTRNRARKFSPYHLSLPQSYLDYNSGEGAYQVELNANDGAVSGETDAVFAEYPTQAGYFFTFNHSSHAYHPRAYDKVSVVKLPDGQYPTWAERPMETCPEGYRRPKESDFSSDTVFLDPAESESLQSWYAKLGNDTMTEASAPEYFLQPNFVTGLYADGSFDRLPKTLIDGVNSLTQEEYEGYVAAPGTGRAAYMGHVIYNPANKASLFIPFAGQYTHNPVEDKMFFGVMGGAWSSSSMGSNANGRKIFFLSAKNSVGYNTLTLMSGTDLPGPIRCVKDEEYPVVAEYEQADYVGAFWRWNETGERVIRIPAYTEAGYDVVPEGVRGTWTAEVTQGAEWIRLSAEQSADNAIYSFSPGKMGINESGSKDAVYAVSGDLTEVSGTCDSSTPIYFRIGLTGQHPSGSNAGVNGTATPRYGMVRLTYAGGTKYSDIYVRQGEAAAYVFDTSDTYDGNTRSKAVRYSPYNLTLPGGYVASETPQLEVRANNGAIVGSGVSAAFTEYPTQGGYMFSSNCDSWAYHPTLPKEDIYHYQHHDYYTWEQKPMETCPTGYRRPNEGTGLAKTYSSAVSEVAQSLIQYPPVLIDSETYRNPGNSAAGYYADGFFDRRTITAAADNGEADSAVEATSASVAYAGQLMFNPATKASVFFPFAGSRFNLVNSGTGYLRISGPGNSGNYYSTLSDDGDGDYSMHAWILLFQRPIIFPEYSVEYYFPTFNTAAKFYLGSIRCVKE